MFGHLIPERRLLRVLGERFQIENPFGGKARGLIRQPVEGSDEQAGYEMHNETEGDLYGDQSMHDAAARVRIFSSLERADRLDGRSPQSRGQAEQERDA